MKPPVLKPLALQHLGQRDLVGAEEEAAVVAGAVLGRELRR